MYPVMLNVQDQRCLVVGGGGVALRKVEGLLSDGARVTVVAPSPIRTISELAAAKRVELSEREYTRGEAAHFSLVFAATDNREVNRRVSEDARAAGVWVNVADDPELCTFHLPARVRRGPFQLTVASAGEAPFVVRRVRQMLERRFGAEWAEWVEAAARFRRAVRTLSLPRHEQEQRYDTFFSQTVDSERLQARVPSEEEEAGWLGSAAPRDRPRSPAESSCAPPQGAGLVSLVGAGPGDAGLLTLRGRRRLLDADVVVYDRLAATALPCDLPAKTELHCVGKEAGHHPTPQEEINALLVRLGRDGKRVVRLKGGDPYVFGRGGEEVEALREAGVPFEVVPCVTAGVAGPAYAGIPVTQRREAVRVTLVTAHEALKSKGPQVRWDMLADPHATLVGYMGVTSLPEVVSELLASGMDPETPAAMIERATTSGQRLVTSTISELPAAIERQALKPPALFVIGRTVRHADKLDWFSRRPLFGERIGAFAPGSELVDRLEMAGAEIVQTPLPVSPAARIVIGALPLSGWIFRDADEVDAIEEERDGPGWDPSVIAWCLTPDGAKRACHLGWQRVETLDGAAEQMLSAMHATLGV